MTAKRKPARRKLGQTVAVVRWFDASYQQGECTIDELVPRVELVTAGLLVQETKTEISVAVDWCESDETWRHVSHIPRVNVLSVKRLKV